MTTSTDAAGSGHASKTTEVAEYIVKRDNERPWSFAGVRLAHATMSKQTLMAMATGNQHDVFAAAIYRTAGGKFITSLSKQMSTNPFVAAFGLRAENSIDELIDESPNMKGYNKAGMFDTIEQAAQWFRPGKLTDSIRKQLGLDDPIRIE